MLTRAHRLTASRLFAPTVRHGRRAGSRTRVVHLAVPPVAPAAPGAADGPARVGFVVSKAVGPAVTRNTVKRQLRHLARERVGSLPCSSLLVVRALPAAASASYDVLGRDLDTALSRVLRRAGDRTGADS